MSCGNESLCESDGARVRREMSCPVARDVMSCGKSQDSLFFLLASTGECDCFRWRMTCSLTRRASSGVSRPDPADDSLEPLGRSTALEEDATLETGGVTVGDCANPASASCNSLAA